MIFTAQNEDVKNTETQEVRGDRKAKDLRPFTHNNDHSFQQTTVRGQPAKRDRDV